jgi:hypothetical protein
MKIFHLLCLLLGLAACSNTSKNDSTNQNIKEKKIISEVVNEAISFTDLKGQAILIGEPIKFLDCNLKEIGDICC